MVKHGIVFIVEFFIFIWCANSFAETLVHINQVTKEIGNASHEEYFNQIDTSEEYASESLPESQNQNSYEELKKEIKHDLIVFCSIIKAFVLMFLLAASLTLAINEWDKIMCWWC
ncbi:MAG: hypothetical protein IAA16_06830 [Candidatus Treponema excrementipullorum]|uniref:Uncharacterized protein n=1 Tax=Candidatus Treponema excrementipullorum TaxID=2838768 RepID=A0A9E2P0R5_9SPIR|nr:hypothetical protein [Candidatus Treponema excrementipullorum]